MVVPPSSAGGAGWAGLLPGRHRLPRTSAHRDGGGLSLAQRARCLLDGGHDVLVAGATAVVALDRVSDLVVARLGVALEEVGRNHDHAGGAEAALQPVLL